MLTAGDRSLHHNYVWIFIIRVLFQGLVEAAPFKDLRSFQVDRMIGKLWNFSIYDAEEGIAKNKALAPLAVSSQFKLAKVLDVLFI